MTTNANLYVDQGIDFAITIDLFDVDGQEFEIVDQEFKCEVRKVFSTSIIFEASIEVNFDDNDENNIDLLIPGSLTENESPGKYQYDIIMYRGNSRTKILEGILFLLPTITRSS